MGSSPVKAPSLSPKRSPKLPGTSSPSRCFSARSSKRAKRRPIRQLNTVVSSCVSPDTKKAAAAIPSIRRVFQSKTSRRKLTDQFDQENDSALGAWPIAHRPTKEVGLLGTILDPSRADTRVYPVDSEDLTKKAEAIAKIQAVQNIGFGFVPFDGLSVAAPGLASFMGNRGLSAPDYSRKCAQAELKEENEACERQVREVQISDCWAEENPALDMDLG